MRPAKGYAPPKFAFRESESLTAPTGERVGVVLLAAGRGSRFGDEAPKTLARLGRRPLVTHAVAAATMSGLRPVVVVVGCQAADVAAAAGALAEVVENPDWESGMSTSLRAGLATLIADPTVTAVAVALADQPRIGADASRRPVLIGRAHFDDAMHMTGDEGARSLLAAHDVVEVPCDGTGDATDVDTPADLAALEEGS